MKTTSNLLSKREGNILAATVKDYIQTATPVASSRVKDVYRFALSPATIRNTMAALERSGYLTHPHTSAGKVPTDKGYRTYVDMLMNVKELDADQAAQVESYLEEISGELDQLMRMVAHIIARLCGGVGITIAPGCHQSRLRSIRLVNVSHQRMLFILDLDGSGIRTVMVEAKWTVEGLQLITLEEILNERLGGLTLEEIEATVGSRLEGTLADDLGITTLILDHSNALFNEPTHGDLYFYGLKQALTCPEFIDQENVVALLGLIENEGLLRTLLLKSAYGEGLTVTIGGEHGDEQLATFATISRSFCYSGTVGTMALLAPKRVNYPRVIAALDFISTTVSRLSGER